MASVNHMEKYRLYVFPKNIIVVLLSITQENVPKISKYLRNQN